jgi:hypothetical protein
VEYLAALNPPGHYVVKSSGGIYAGFSWHVMNIAYLRKVETQKNKNVPLMIIMKKV